MTRIALGLEYHGSAYCGWQSQPSGTAVQDLVENAIAKFIGIAEAGNASRIICAGRTDTGVHALAQVIHFDTSVVRESQSWLRGVNAHLPDDIRLLWAHQLPDELGHEFHARYSARSRRYHYLLLNDAVDVGLQLGQVGWYYAELNVEAMREAAASILGTHDFSVFRSAECQAKTPIKTIYEADIVRQGQLIQFNFRANAFLHHMVRNIIGCLVYIGAGKQDSKWLSALIESRNRAIAAPTFAPDGLYLANVEYDAKFQLPAFRERKIFNKAGATPHG
jgi:tRNA pseudouridine38-40 synthase